MKEKLTDGIEEYLLKKGITWTGGTLKTNRSILRAYCNKYKEDISPEMNYIMYIKQLQKQYDTNYPYLCAVLIREYYKYNDIPVDTLYLPPQIKKTRHSLTREQLETLLENTSGTTQHIIRILSLTGLRVGELSNLRYCDIDMQGRTLHVTRGKGNKQRTVPLNREAVNLIDSIRETEEQEYVLTNKSGNQLSVRMIQYHIREAGSNCGIKVTPHILRHTYATMMIQKGLDVSILQRILGHENLGTTATYLHTNFSTVQEAFDKIM